MEKIEERTEGKDREHERTEGTDNNRFWRVCGRFFWTFLHQYHLALWLS